MQWFEDEEFWRQAEPFLFDDDRMQAAPAEAAAVCNLLDLEPPAAVLDLCCGTGRHALALARSGYHVTGVDRSHTLLQHARAAAIENALDIDWREQDMRAFAEEDRFDAALNLYTSFGYFDDPEDDLTVATNMLRSLRSGGRALFEMTSKEILARDWRDRWWRETDGQLLLEERQISGSFEAVQCRWVVVDGTTRHELNFCHRLYSAVELRRLLLEAGYSAVALYGSWQGDPFDQEAERLIAVAQAP